VTDASTRRFKAYRRGHRGEWLAALALMAKGFRIVERRYRTKLGEIDLIARRGDLVLIVEVKGSFGARVGAAHRGLRRPLAVAAIGLRKIVGAVRHGGGAAVALACACAERFLRAELEHKSDLP
jgi:Holliday junction resolvase-like predicted endonuclease